MTMAITITVMVMIELLYYHLGLAAIRRLPTDTHTHNSAQMAQQLSVEHNGDESSSTPRDRLQITVTM